MAFWCFLSRDGAITPLPFKIFSGDGSTDLEVRADLIGAGMVEEEKEEVVVMAVVAVEFILTLAPSAFTRLGIFSRLTTGTGTLKHQSGEEKQKKSSGCIFCTALAVNSYQLPCLPSAWNILLDVTLMQGLKFHFDK